MEDQAIVERGEVLFQGNFVLIFNPVGYGPKTSQKLRLSLMFNRDFKVFDKQVPILIIHCSSPFCYDKDS